MHIVFDLDHTLIDTSTFVRDLFDIFARQGVAQIDITDTYAQIFQDCGGAYDFDLHIQLLAQKFPALDAQIAQNDFAQFQTDIAKYILPQTIDILKQLKQDGVQMTLLTKGSPTIQNLKITGTGLDRIFDDIVICQGNKADAVVKLAPTTRTIFLNDNWHETQEIMSIAPQLNYFLLQRPDFAKFYQPQEVTIPLIKSIPQFAQIIKSANNQKPT